MTQFCNPAKKPRVEAMASETFLPGTLAAIMESDEDKDEIAREMTSSLLLSMEMSALGNAPDSKGAGDGSAGEQKKTPKKPFTDAETIARGILWDIFCQVTRWDRKCDFNADPNSAPESNIFDTHCHIDRIYGSRTCGNKFQILRNNYTRIYDKFEGCITSFCDLNFIVVRIK